MLRALEHLGISQVYGVRYFGDGSLKHTIFTQFIRHTALSESYMNSSINFAKAAGERFSEVKVAKKQFADLFEM